MDTHENDDFFNGQEKEYTPVPEQPQDDIPEEPVQEPADAVAEEPAQEPADTVTAEAVPEEPAEAAYQEQTQFYHNAGAGRKESPFADSPYVMSQQAQQNAYQAYSNVPPAKKPRKAKKSGRKVWKGILAVVLALAVVGGSCGITAALVNNHWEDKTGEMEQRLTQKILDLQNQLNRASMGDTVIIGDNVSVEGALSPSQVYALNVNSVVAISNQSTTTNIFGQVTETASSGSGFIVSEDGYVVTNCHVVEGANTLTVITADSTEYNAELIGSDATNDIALLKIDATGLNPVTIGSSDALIVGDQVVAIGNPLGELTSTLTVGYISAKDRTITASDGTSINMMQTDAAINSGNSGGPLFNAKGEVIGITSAKYSGETSSGTTIEGIGFAIPIDDVIGMLEDLRDYGYVTGAYLGVSVRSLDASTAALYSLPTGSLVSTVEEGSCAAAAGIQPQDIITGLGDYEISGNSDLIQALRKFKAGDTTTISVYRGGQELELSITLDEKPAPAEEASGEVQEIEPSTGSGSSSGFPPFGFGFGG